MISTYDICVIGGGVNGAGIARDAAGRGLKVVLAEKGDLASGTSSASTKLIHGGLRYLEYYEFGLVRDSLKEREVLLRLAPHIIRPMNFILPHDGAQRPAWMISSGLFLYDHLAKRRRLPASCRLKFSGAVLKDIYKRGFSYADCWVDDARLVAINAQDAAEHGADILTRAECVSMKAVDGRWRVTLKNADGQTQEIEAAMVVNATGPWVGNFITRMGFEGPDVPAIRLVKGSHIIVPRMTQGEDAFILQQPDKRIVFVIPYEEKYTLIGTTEENFEGGDPADPAISSGEIDYLIGAFNRSFRHQISKSDIIWTCSGVRPLLDDGASEARSVTRDYRLFEHENLGASLLSVFGGKLTTYRVLSEKVMNIIARRLGKFSLNWTAGAVLPGGEIAPVDFKIFLNRQIAQYDFLPKALVKRYAMTYGARMDRFLDGARSSADLGQDFGDGLYEAEIIYLIRDEFARSDEDILWRRTKLGLHVTDQTVENLKAALPALLKKTEIS